MAIAKALLFLSLLIVVIAVYFYRTADEDKRKEFMISSSVTFYEGLLTLDRWLPFLKVHSLFRFIENSMSSFNFNRLNRTGLIVGVRKFDGVEVIVFDVLHHEKKRPVIIFIHGGGWSVMNSRMYSDLTADLARRLNTMVVSVNYRKAPEHPFPAAFDDVLAAVNYLFINAVTLDIDPGRVVLMGDSAGGNLAVAVGYHMSAMRRRNQNAHVPKLIVPLCPLLQIADMNLPSFRDNVHDFMLSKKLVTQFVCFYALGEVSRHQWQECMDAMATNSHLNENAINHVTSNMDWSKFLKGKGYDNRPRSQFHYKPTQLTQVLSKFALDPRFSPLSALNDTEIRLLPPMYIFSASRDPLRDDGKLLWARLVAVGNLVSYHEVDYYHDPFVLSPFNITKTVRAMNQLVALFNTNAIM